MEDIHHVAGNLNPADVTTRGLAKVEDIGPGSFWQKGPSFLCSRRDIWPVTRDFVRKDLPDNEICSKPAFLYCARAWILSSDAGISTCPASKSDHPVPDLWVAVERVSHYSNNIKKVVRILAMVIKGWKL